MEQNFSYFLIFFNSISPLLARLGCSSTSSGTHRNFSESLARPENTRTSFAEAIEVSKNHNQRVDSGTEGDLSDEASNVIQKRNQKRGILPKQATAILRSWLFQHIVVSNLDH